MSNRKKLLLSELFSIEQRFRSMVTPKWLKQDQDTGDIIAEVEPESAKQLMRSNMPLDGWRDSKTGGPIADEERRILERAIYGTVRPIDPAFAQTIEGLGSRRTVGRRIVEYLWNLESRSATIDEISRSVWKRINLARNRRTARKQIERTRDDMEAKRLPLRINIERSLVELVRV